MESDGPLTMSERMQVKSHVRELVHGLRNLTNCIEIEVSLVDPTNLNLEAREAFQSIREQIQSAEELITIFSQRFRHYPDPPDSF